MGLRTGTAVLLLLGVAGCSNASAKEPPSGQALFQSTCARCHGREGTGGPPLGNGQPAPRNLTDPAFQSARTDAQLGAVIRSGKGGVMPSFKDVFTDAEIDALVAHVRSLERK